MPMSEYLRELRRHVGHAMIMAPGVSAVVRDDAGALLLGRRSDDGRWSLPAGSVDPGEQPADAIVREVREESGVEIRVDGIAGVALHPHTYPNGDRCQFLNVWFRCTAIGGQARVADDESLEVRWFAPDALPPVDDWVRHRVEVALRNQPAAWFAAPGTVVPALGF
ncbi:MAG TPA: NUDIX domain-containing protein [Actinoplanes sp.]|nr:NUDIX domain-containing protein [Actinoplanes sp.]